MDDPLGASPAARRAPSILIADAFYEEFCRNLSANRLRHRQKIHLTKKHRPKNRLLHIDSSVLGGTPNINHIKRGVAEHGKGQKCVKVHQDAQLGQDLVEPESARALNCICRKDGNVMKWRLFLERLPTSWSHPIEKESLRFKVLEHVLIKKLEQLFRDML